MVEDGTHFLVECPAWGRQRARMMDFLRGELEGLRGGMGALGTTWADWWISLSREAQADLLAGGQVALADKWSRADSSKIVAALLVAFNRHVWQMWRARTRRSEAMHAGRRRCHCSDEPDLQQHAASGGRSRWAAGGGVNWPLANASGM